VKLRSRLDVYGVDTRPEETFDASFIANADLDVALGVESGTSVERFAFDEHRPHRIVRSPMVGFVVLMQELNHRTVEMAQDEILRRADGSVGRHRQADTSQLGSQGLMTLFHQGQWRLFQQVEAVAEIGDRAKGKGATDGGATFARSFGLSLCLLQGAGVVTFPEVEPVPKPVVIVFAATHRHLASDDALTNALVATVETDDKGWKSGVHRDGSTIAGREFALLRDDPSFNQEPQRLALGFLFRQLS